MKLSKTKNLKYSDLVYAVDDIKECWQDRQNSGSQFYVPCGTKTELVRIDSCTAGLIKRWPYTNETIIQNCHDMVVCSGLLPKLVEFGRWFRMFGEERDDYESRERAMNYKRIQEKLKMLFTNEEIEYIKNYAGRFK